MKKFKTYLAESFEPKKVAYGSEPSMPLDNKFKILTGKGMKAYVAYFKVKDTWFALDVNIDTSGVVSIGFGIQTKDNPGKTDFSDDRKHVKMSFLRVINNVIYLITELLRTAGNLKKVVFQGKDKKRYTIYKKMVNSKSFKKMIAKYKYRVEPNDDPFYETITITYTGNEKDTITSKEKPDYSWLM